MDWLEVHVETNHAGLDAVETFLSARGVDGVVIEDEAEFRDFLEENRAHWDYVDDKLSSAMRGKSRVTFYLPADEEGFARLATLRVELQDFRREHAEFGTLLMTMDDLSEADWENNWKQYYRPTEVGRRLLIVPEWEKEEAAKVRRWRERVPLILEPGLTFGTGSHATTQLCLAALEATVCGGERVLDLGCGSGILSIAALKLGAAEAVAVDIDEACRGVAYENAARNGIGKDRYTVTIGDVLTDGALRASLGGGYDIVVANIVADVILALSPIARDFLKPGGVFLVSGIIDSRAEEVSAQLEKDGWALAPAQSRDGWFAYACRQNAERRDAPC